MRLLLVSHAAGTAAGLSEGARTRAAEIGRALPRPRVAFTSPALEAVQTAEALGLHAAVEPRLLDGDVRPWLDGRRGDRGTTAAVTHAAVVRAAVALVLGAANADAIDMASCSVTELRFRAGRWHVAYVNWEPALLHIPQRRGRHRKPRPENHETSTPRAAAGRRRADPDDGG